MKKAFWVSLVLFISLFSVCNISNAYTFTRTLTVGSNGDDVFQLQKLLNSNSYTTISATGAGSIGNESYYFGTKTADGVRRLQELHSSNIFTNAEPSFTGIFGPLTRNYINSLTPVSMQTPSLSIPKAIPKAVQNENIFGQKQFFGKEIVKNSENSPRITKISALNVSTDDNITVTGENFGKSVSIFSSIGIIDNKKVKNGSITFSIDEINSDLGEMSGMPVTFSIGNRDGISSNYGYIMIK
jgi:hypothetical protein